jgi:hypothetical protein
VLRQVSQPWNQADRRIIIVGHPDDKVKQLRMSGYRQEGALVCPCQGCRRPGVWAAAAASSAPVSQSACYSCCVIEYNSDTLSGSSGSPILDMQGDLLGVHFGAGDIDTGRPNKGTVASAVFHRLLAHYESCKAARTADSQRALELLRDCLSRDTKLQSDLQLRLMP